MPRTLKRIPPRVSSALLGLFAPGSDGGGRIHRGGGSLRSAVFVTVLVGALTITALLAVVGSARARSLLPVRFASAGSTDMYSGKRLVGKLPPHRVCGRDLCWSAECLYETSGDVVMAPKRNWINVVLWDGRRDGFGRRVRTGRWAIYTIYHPQEVFALAVQRGANRWDVVQGRRVIGYTEGPDGPAAAAALLLLCS
jgi:hypothetical protein